MRQMKKWKQAAIDTKTVLYLYRDDMVFSGFIETITICKLPTALIGTIIIY